MTFLELLRPQPIRLLFDALLLPNISHMPSFLLDLRITEWGWQGIVLFVSLSIAGISLAISVVKYLLEVKLAYVGNKVVSRLRKSVFRHLIELPVIFHDTQQTGDLVVRMSGDILLMRDLFVNFIINFVGRITLIVGMLTVMALMNLKLTLIVLVMLPAMVWITSNATKQVGKLTRKQRKHESDLAQSVHEIIGEMRVFAAYGRKDIEDERFDSNNRRSFKNDVKSRRVRARLSGVTEMTLAAAIVIIIFLGTREVMQDRLSAGQLLVFLSYLRTMFKPIRSVVNMTGRMGKAAACAERVIDILETPVELKDLPNAIPAPEFEGNIVLQDVTLTYDGKARALRKINLHIKPGEIVGLTGHSGSGKSSLCMLIPRLYDPDSGCVMIDGRDIRDYTLESLRSQISLVLQDPGIFHLSIAENVAFGQVECPRDKIIQACKETELHESIVAMPEKYDTLVGERGMMLSGGQRRRLAIARGLVRSPRILILDEPFAGLDDSIAEGIADTILRISKDRTIIIVSHHPHHLTRCTRIIEMSMGMIIKNATRFPIPIKKEEAANVRH
jgi:ABC-type multidrug transport system fused ATPase/permease subunit